MNGKMKILDCQSPPSAAQDFSLPGLVLRLIYKLINFKNRKHPHLDTCIWISKHFAVIFGEMTHLWHRSFLIHAFSCMIPFVRIIHKCFHLCTRCASWCSLTNCAFVGCEFPQSSTACPPPCRQMFARYNLVFWKRYTNQRVFAPFRDQ